MNNLNLIERVAEFPESAILPVTLRIPWPVTLLDIITALNMCDNPSTQINYSIKRYSFTKNRIPTIETHIMARKFELLAHHCEESGMFVTLPPNIVMIGELTPGQAFSHVGKNDLWHCEQRGRDKKGRAMVAVITHGSIKIVNDTQPYWQEVVELKENDKADPHHPSKWLEAA